MDPLSEYPPLMTPTEVADYTGLSVERLSAWRKAGRGPTYIKVGEGQNGAVRYPREALREYLTARTVPPAVAP